MHDRVADDRQLEDRVALDAGPHRELGEQPVERPAHRECHLGRPAVVHHRVADPAHQVLAEPDLRVHHAGAREDRAVAEVREVAGDRRRADVDRDPVGPLVETWPDPRDRPPAVDGDRDGVLPGLEGGLERADHRQVGVEVVEVPLIGEGQLETEQVAGRRGQLGRLHLDVVEADDGVQVEVANVEALPDDLAIDLALGRHVDHDVAAEMGGAGEAPLVSEALAVAVSGLDRAERRQVVGRRDDPVLGELADALLHLAAAADPAPAADRVDVDAELPRGIQDGRAGTEPATPARRREDDERVAGHGLPVRPIVSRRPP